MVLSLADMEAELRKRLDLPYDWGNKRQNRRDDELTQFIYEIPRFGDLLARMDREFLQEANRSRIRDYALNRWFNYWSSRAVEEVFCAQPLVVPAERYDRKVDFFIDGVPFDHKTSIYPERFGQPFADARARQRELIEWLYRNQSQEDRKHLRNRLFVMLHDSNSGEHWKLKAEIALIRAAVEEYVMRFDKSALHRFRFEAEEETLSDLIWIVR
ncbi:MAG: hypothetical protein Q7T82_11100 [Armatimonadota bacterium]|nr:hypothetical protein [Armatimonadota bacterium]